MLLVLGRLGWFYAFALLHIIAFFHFEMQQAGTAVEHVYFRQYVQLQYQYLEV